MNTNSLWDYNIFGGGVLADNPYYNFPLVINIHTLVDARLNEVYTPIEYIHLKILRYI